MSKPSPNQPRPKALATLEALIARAEGEADPLRRAVERLAATGGDPGRAIALLQVAEERLARLRESRRALLDGEAGDAPAEVARRRRGRRKTPGDTGEPR